MITLTDSAVQAIGRFIKGSDTSVAGLRVMITGGGCSGFQYGLRLEENAGADDTVIDCGNDVKVLIDPISVPLLAGVKIDFVDSIDGSGFKFENPNATSSCACGSSFSAGH
ncbi:HesB/IscA family protein [Beggiatoa leptomitoformis]|uniref:Iron-sulfur cluster assembly accessory protein n=1 Tax=Beggiatoa leptomitoformis TaxID=288004 RepID=A0A2N9YIP5_9GAMM|nr:iron-sulfur cluster assembly accessory protein [Beggiatoa leptomitoformis]ALG67413.1 iron-sulfur cluster assembly accessory protein [Beggiatoa leptomitoformis]AUI70374.1 iron-sulfur cluster assembly accessory protein [Beggiatoa leptomitoformis]